MSEYSCDLCGNETENGAGHYLEQLGSDDRVCADCFHKVEAEFRLLVVKTELAKPCVHCSRQVFPTVNGWADPEATDDDYMWRFVCDSNENFRSEHEVDA